jgi:putative ATP-dependent endonuclease of OLD family
MKLKDIEIGKFKTIENLSVSISDMLIMVGENNCGKSNILHALELFYQDSVRGIDEESFCFKDCSFPISLTLIFDRLEEAEKSHLILKNWIYNDEIKIKKVIQREEDTGKYNMQFFGWQAKPIDEQFDMSKFDEYKADLKKIVEEKSLPNYFKTDKGTVTQTSYKDGVREHIDKGLVQMGEPGWIANPGGYKEVFGSLLPRFYLLPAVKDAQDESKTTQQTVFGKLINDLTNRIVSKNPKFEEVKKQIDGLRKYLNKRSDGDDSERLQEIKDLETTLSSMISENLPNTKVAIEIVTPELIDLFKDTVVNIDDSLLTSINAKGHGLQRALVFAYIRAYAKFIGDTEKSQGKGPLFGNFILAIEEPELYWHPNGQRKMFSVLEEISKTDQVIICTHSNFFVNMHNYKNIAIVNRDNSGPTKLCQYRGDIFDTENQESQKRLRKIFRYLSLFDLSRSEMFFAKKVVLVEGDTEKFIIPFCSFELIVLDKKYDLSGKNICVIECGGKNNIHIFMRVLNRFKIPYIVLHDVDPIDFHENKPDKTDKEKHELSTFKENELIRTALDESVGRVITFNPEFEKIIEVSKSQTDKHGKVQAAYNKYDGLAVKDYPTKLINVINLLIEWDKPDPVIEVI